MSKLVYMPISLASGLLAGLVSRRAFALVWGAVDNAAPPQPEQRVVALRKLILALTIEGAMLRLVKGLIDHGSRRGFAQLTGVWPGEHREPERPSEGA